MSLSRLLMASLKISCPSTGPWIREQHFISALRKAGWSGLMEQERISAGQATSLFCHTGSSPTQAARTMPRAELPRLRFPWTMLRLRKLKRSPKGSSKQLRTKLSGQSLLAKTRKSPSLRNNVPKCAILSRAPPSPAEPSPQERARHMLTHLPPRLPERQGARKPPYSS